MKVLKQVFWIVLLALLVVPTAGCKKETPDPPSELEAWRAMAKQSLGHSPHEREDLTEKDVDRLTVDKPDFMLEKERQTTRDLPHFNVSLRMHDADLIAVIQALARAAGQSIVVSPTVQGRVNINIQDMPWNQVFTGILRTNRLSYAWEGDIIRVVTAEDMESDLQFEVLRKKRQFERLELEKLEPLSTAVIKIKYSNAEDLKTSLEKFLSKEGEKTLGSIEVDKHTNALIIQAISADLKKLVKLVSRLDSPRKQIRLKAFIVETTTDTARALGVQWGGGYEGNVADGNNLWLVPGGTEGNADTSPLDGDYTPYLNQENESGVSGQGYAFNFLPNSDIYSSGGNGMALGMMFGKVGGSVLEMQLHALESESLLNIISSPSITTMDNQKAYTESGERVPYQSTSGDSGTTIEFEDAVLRLEITPHIIDNAFMKLKVLIKKDEVGTKTVGDNPRITKKTTETTLIARDGETVVISGLNKDRSLKDDAGVPYLKDLPGLGWAFRSKSRSKVLDEFLIFITPQILDVWQPGETQKSMQEIQDELKAIWEKENQKEADTVDQ